MKKNRLVRSFLRTTDPIRWGRTGQVVGIFLLLIHVSAFSAEPARSTPVTQAAPPKRYTVQAGTYLTFGTSLTLFMRLASILDPADREDLRIEKLEKYHVIRIGSDDDRDKIRALAGRIRRTVPDAFVLLESDETDQNTVYLYPGVAPGGPGYALSFAGFPSQKEAMSSFARLGKTLGDSPGRKLRVTERSGLFTVSVGPYADFAEARRLQKQLRASGHHPAIVESDPRKDRVLVEAAALKTDPQTAASAEKEQPQTKEAAAPPAADAFAADDVMKPLERIDETLNGLLDSQQYGKAIEVVKRAIERWPDNPDLYAWYGEVLMAMNRPDKAIEHYEKAAQLAPSVPQYQSNVGYGYMNMHLDTAKRSIDAFNRALALDPRNVDALEGLGAIYVSIGKTDLAADIQQELQDLDPEAAARLHALITRGIDWNR